MIQTIKCIQKGKAEDLEIEVNKWIQSNIDPHKGVIKIIAISFTCNSATGIYSAFLLYQMDYIK